MMKRVTALALTFVAALAAPAALAQDNGRTCLNEAVVRTGGTANTELLARKRARDAWRQKVEENNGKEFSAWYLAKGHDYSCFMQDGKHRCKVSATPCESPIVIQGPGKICNFYRIDATGEPSSSSYWAAHRARKKWSMRANMLVGDDFDTWIFGNNRKVDCKTNAEGLNVCTARAIPCRIRVIN